MLVAVALVVQDAVPDVLLVAVSPFWKPESVEVSAGIRLPNTIVLLSAVTISGDFCGGSVTISFNLGVREKSTTPSPFSSTRNGEAPRIVALAKSIVTFVLVAVGISANEVVAVTVFPVTSCTSSVKYPEACPFITR